jgi:Phage terminase, small subunit
VGEDVIMDWNKIRQEYESTEISLRELAEKHGLKYPTVKSRKQRDKWEKGASTKDASKGKKDASKDASKKTRDASKGKASRKEPEVELIINNKEDSELTERQRLFCLYFVKYWSATKAYQKAYECGYNTAHAEGYKQLAEPCVKKEIEKLKQDIRDGIALEVMAVLQKYIDIAFADITDFVEFGQIERNVIAEGQMLKDENGEYLKESINYVNLKNHGEVDGLLITEVKQGKDGISLKLADKMKALEVLTKYLDLLPDHHKRRIEEEKLKLEQDKFNHDKAKNNGSEGVDKSNERIMTLAGLFNNPVQDRKVEDFESGEDND